MSEELVCMLQVFNANPKMVTFLHLEDDHCCCYHCLSQHWNVLVGWLMYFMNVVSTELGNGLSLCVNLCRDLYWLPIG